MPNTHKQKTVKPKPEISLNTMKKKLLLSAAAVLGITLQSLALPANPTPRVITQPDGSTITIVMHGDEYGSYITNLNGDIIQRCDDGFFRYSQMSEGVCIASQYIARDNNEENNDLQLFLQQVDQDAITSHIARGAEARRKTMSYEARPEGAPLRQLARATADGEVKKVRGLVILAEFQDVKFSENGTVENINALMNEEGNDYLGGIGSARDYFLDQSFGKFEPTFDVIGPVTLPEKESYYGAPQDGYSGGDDGSKVYYMPLHACDAAYEQGLCDFSDYDCDGDGVVDLVFVVYAGYAESSGADKNTIWPHAAWVGSLNANKDREYNGVKLDAYACTSELAGIEGTNLYGIGAICHEFSHTLGLPDWYDTKGMGGFGMNKWSVMDQGCHNFDGRVPCGYNAYEREFCGWMSITELTEKASIQLENVATSATAYKVVANNNTDRYFTIETRVKTGWDQYLPTEGILIIKVDYDADAWDMQNNSVNTLPARQRFQFVPADNKADVNTFEGDLWPNGNQNSFSDTTTPKMKIHLTTIKDKPLTNIAFDTTTKIGSFDFKGGDSGIFDITASGIGTYYDGCNIVVKNNVATEATIYNIQGMIVATVPVVNGEATYQPDTKGLYIVRCGNESTKVNVR